MPGEAKNIVVSYNGEGAKVNYWAGGHGKKVNGYLTSLRQLESGLNKYFHTRSLELYTLLNRKLVHITSDSRLKQALATVPSGGYLCVYAYGQRGSHSRTVKFSQRSPFTVYKTLPTMVSKRQPNTLAPPTALQKKLERMFPA